MISRTPSPSISPTKSSLVITSARSSRTRGAATSVTDCSATAPVPATGSAGSSALFGLRPLRLGTAAASTGCSSATGATATVVSVSAGTSEPSSGERPSTFTPDIRGRRPRRLGSSAGTAFGSVSLCCPATRTTALICSSNSFFFNITFPTPKALPISRNSARLLPSSALKSCINCLIIKSKMVKNPVG